MIDCPMCISSPPMFLGLMGNQAHFRCQDCGIDFSINIYKLPVGVLAQLQERSS